MTIRTNLEIRTEHVLYTVAGIAIFYAAYKGYKAASLTGGAVVNSVNPVSDKNIVYSGVNGIGKVVSGDKDFTLGGWIYDLTHPQQANYKPLAEDTRIINMANSEGIGL